MKFNQLVLVVVVFLMIQSCGTQKNKIFWVSGIKSECSAGAGTTTCLKIHRGNDLTNPNWENFYSNIEGFEFEEGVLKKIEVKEEKLEKVPADASSIKYIMVSELDKQADTRTKLDGSWILYKINDHPINRSIQLPEMGINLELMQVSGLGGCNNYSGKINKLTSNVIQFGDIISTLKSCLNKNIEKDYFEALNGVSTYQVMENDLVFYNKTGEKVLAFLKKDKTAETQRLHDIWIATQVFGVEMEKTNTPRMELNLREMTVLGNDSCNEFNGKIDRLSESFLSFGKLASTRKMCPKMEIANEFNRAIELVSSYKLEGLNLVLLDRSGSEVITFMKGD